MSNADPGERAGVVEPRFEFSSEGEAADVLLAGFSNFGQAGLTAVDFIVDQLDLDRTGHVTAEQLPAITPFENGTPRHHTRLFSADDLNVTVLTNELFVPVYAAGPFSDAVFEWIEANDVAEVAILAGVPVPHGPDDHRVYYVATEDYRERRLAESDVPPMGTGFLDGVNAEIIGRGIDSELAVGVFVTPVHPQAPDVDAALRLIDAAASVYDIDVDTGPLEAFAAEIEQYYRDLSERLKAAPDAQMPDDRMYM